MSAFILYVLVSFGSMSGVSLVFLCNRAEYIPSAFGNPPATSSRSDLETT